MIKIEMAITQQLDENMVLPLRFVGGVVVALLGALLLFYVYMRPPINDLELIALFLSLTCTGCWSFSLDNWWVY